MTNLNPVGGTSLLDPPGPRPRNDPKSSLLVPIFPMPSTKFKVGMTCGGCANACKRILSKIEGVTEVKTDVDAKIVEVIHNGVEEDVMFAKLKKWSEASGKTLERWTEEDETKQ